MSWFREWVKTYCTATGADDRTAQALLADERIVVDHWGACLEELGEIGTRLVASGRVPNFAAEHIRAIGKELIVLRNERDRVDRPAPGNFDDTCSACGGVGLAIIPVRSCVWNGRLVLHREHKRVVFGGVLCDRPGCRAGRHAQDLEQRRDKGKKSALARLSQCERELGGIDLPELTREYEREKSRRCRMADGSSDTVRTLEFRGMYPRIAERIGRPVE
jgi:hypothetical protein